MIMAVVRRTAAGRSPFAADKEHLHHRLLQIGHSKQRAVLIMYLWAALISSAVILATVTPQMPFFEFLPAIGFGDSSVSSPEPQTGTALLITLQQLLAIKPHLQAILGYNVGTGLAKGTTYIAMDWDFDVALAQQSNSNIKWVLPEEGATAYLEGFFAIKDTPRLAVLESFFDLFLEPKEYADFVNTTGTAYVEQAATPYVDKTISGNKALVADPTSLAKVEFELFVGQAIAEYTKVWDQFKSA